MIRLCFAIGYGPDEIRKLISTNPATLLGLVGRAPGAAGPEADGRRLAAVAE